MIQLTPIKPRQLPSLAKMSAEHPECVQDTIPDLIGHYINRIYADNTVYVAVYVSTVHAGFLAADPIIDNLAILSIFRTPQVRLKKRDLFECVHSFIRYLYEFRQVAVFIILVPEQLTVNIRLVMALGFSQIGAEAGQLIFMKTEEELS